MGRHAAPGGSYEAGPYLASVWDAATGEERATGLPGGALVVGVWPGHGGQVVYAVARSLDGSVDLVSCDSGSATCDTVVDHAADAPPLVLPEDFSSKEPTQ